MQACFVQYIKLYAATRSPPSMYDNCRVAGVSSVDAEVNPNQRKKKRKRRQRKRKVDTLPPAPQAAAATGDAFNSDHVPSATAMVVQPSACAAGGSSAPSIVVVGAGPGAAACSSAHAPVCASIDAASAATSVTPLVPSSSVASTTFALSSTVRIPVTPTRKAQRVANNTQLMLNTVNANHLRKCVGCRKSHVDGLGASACSCCHCRLRPGAESVSGNCTCCFCVKDNSPERCQCCHCTGEFLLLWREKSPRPACKFCQGCPVADPRLPCRCCRERKTLSQFQGRADRLLDLKKKFEAGHCPKPLYRDFATLPVSQPKVQWSRAGSSRSA